MGATAGIDVSDFFLRQIEERQLDLPMLPGVAAEITSLCADQTADAARMSAVIHRDQTLAGNVLRVANSPLYCGQMPCVSLQQAISRLGMRSIAEIAMAVTVRGRLFQGKQFTDLLRHLWRHAVVAGFLCKEIARTRRQNVEIAFLAGLLHDIGKAVLLTDLEKAKGDSAVEIALDDLLAALHEHHTAAGRLLANEWRLPDQIAEGIEFHHDYEAASRYADMAMMVCLADLLAHAMTRPTSENAGDALRRHPVIAGLNLYPDQLTEIMDRGDAILEMAEVVG